MNRLDRHISWRYLVNIVALFAALFSFVVTVDVFLNLKRFLEAAGDARPGAKGFELAIVTALMVVDIWGPRLLQLFNYLIGVVLVAGMGFTCVHFVRHREFIAVLASGVSLHRLAWPLFAVALVVTGVGALNQELALPAVAALLPREPGQAGQASVKAFRVPLVEDGLHRLFYAARFDAAPKDGGPPTMVGVHVWERNEAGGVVRRIHADRATWDGGAWRLEHGEAEAVAAPGRVEPVERIVTNLDPTAILVSQIQGYGQSLSWRAIGRTLAHPAMTDDATRARLERLRWGRVSVALCNLLALGLAMPFFLVREPKNMVVQSLKCAPLALGALIGAVLGAAAPLPGLPVWLGVFVPALVLTPLAIWGAISVKT